MEPIIVSASGLASFLRCRKSYQIQYEWQRGPFKTNDAVSLGSAFHKVMEQVALNNWQLPPLTEDTNFEARDLALHYMNNHSRPGIAGISAEVPQYTLIHPENGLRPGMYLRTTFDLLYWKTEETVVIRDYKTFSREPSLDVDMDIQARLYCAVVSERFRGKNVEFEYEYVRSVVPGSVRTVKTNTLYTPADCYRTVTINISELEKSTILQEVRWAFDDIYQTRINKRYYRNGLKGTGMYTCSSCFSRDICQKELEYGTLTEDDLNQMSNKREPLELPTAEGRP